MYIDSHAHLNMIPIHNPDNKLSEISLDKLEYIVHISLNPQEFLENHPILTQFSNVLFATGIYPDHAANPDFDLKENIKQLKQILTQYPHVALGEAGIDLKNDSYGSLTDQENLFRLQVALAEKLDLPIVVHSRMSFEPTFKVLSEYSTKAIFHCFSYGIEEADKILERGDYLSFAGQLTYKKALEIQEVAKIIPLDRLLFETDSPYLSPVPLRGKTNTPINVGYTYQYFAHLRNIPLDTLIAQVHLNFLEIFSIK